MTRLEQLRFNRLVRLNLQRFVDPELVPADAEPHKLLVSALAILLGFAATLCLLMGYRYLIRADALSPQQLFWAHAGDQLLLVTLVMAGAGFFSVLGWDALYPDRRDAFVLGALPLSTPTLFRARLFALLLWFFLLMAALQLLPALMVPVVLFPSHFFLALFAQLTALTAAAAAVFFGVLALQGLLLSVLSYDRFLRVSSFFQLCVLLASFALVFLTPSPAAAARRHFDWAAFLPAYWFLDLWRALQQQDPVLGSRPAPFVALATAALIALSLCLFALLYRRVLRKAVEGQALADHGPGLLSRAFVKLLSLTLLPEPRGRAVFLFTARGLARLRTHRLVLALYAGLGLAWVLAGASSLLEHGLPKSGWAPSPLSVSIPIDLAFFCIVGLRVLFTLPVELKANWLFQLVADGARRPLEHGVRLFLFLAGVLPMALAPLPFLFSVWRPAQVALHLGFYLLEAWLLVELALSGLHKLPFTCSWLPGKANLQVRLGAFLVAFGGGSAFLAAVEAAQLSRPSRGILVVWAMLLAGIFHIRRRAAQARLESPHLRFEERPDPAVHSLHLAR